MASVRMLTRGLQRVMTHSVYNSRGKNITRSRGISLINYRLAICSGRTITGVPMHTVSMHFSFGLSKLFWNYSCYDKLHPHVLLISQIVVFLSYILRNRSASNAYFQLLLSVDANTYFTANFVKICDGLERFVNNNSVTNNDVVWVFPPYSIKSHIIP